MQSNSSSDPLLSEIAQDFLNEDDSGSAVEKQLAESKKMSDSKLKENSVRYLCPVNCEILTALRVNPENWDKLMSPFLSPKPQIDPRLWETM